MPDDRYSDRIITRAELEDEVMELRAKLQLMATDRDFWKGEAVAWKAGYDGLLASFDEPR